MFTVECEIDTRNKTQVHSLTEQSKIIPAIAVDRLAFGVMSIVTKWLDYFSIFGQLATMKISQIMSQVCQSRLSILPNKK